MTQHAEIQAQAMVDLEALGVKKDAANSKDKRRAKARASARQAVTQDALGREKNGRAFLGELGPWSKSKWGKK